MLRRTLGKPDDRTDDEDRERREKRREKNRQIGKRTRRWRGNRDWSLGRRKIK